MWPPPAVWPWLDGVVKILLPHTVEPVELPGHEVVVMEADVALPDEHHDAEAYVIWGQPRDRVLADMEVLPRLRLLQGLAAGAEPVTGVPLPDGAVACTGVGLHGPMVGEHVVALVLALLRRLPTSIAAQRDHEWVAESLGRPRPLSVPGKATETLLGAHVVIWGLGDIGATIARLVKPFGAHVTGVARTAGMRDGIPVVTDIDEVLPTTDVLVMCIPGGDATRHALDARRIALLPPGQAFVVNIGRGSTIDQAALADALRSGRLAGAGLDVTDPEPLPADSDLWDCPNTIITPHTAGGRPVGVQEFLAAQLAGLDDGTLRNQLA